MNGFYSLRDLNLEMTLFPVRDYETHSQVRMETLIVSSSRRLTWAQLPQSSRIAACSYFLMAPLIIWTTSSDRGLGSTSFSQGESMVFLTMQGLSNVYYSTDIYFQPFLVESVGCPADIPRPAHTSGVTMDAGSSVMEGKTTLCLASSSKLLLTQVHWTDQGCDVHRVLC